VLDIGSGQGYLSRVLAMQKGLDVIGVEAESCNVNAAAKSDKVVAAELLSKGWTGDAHSASNMQVATPCNTVQHSASNMQVATPCNTVQHSASNMQVAKASSSRCMYIRLYVAP
jgi:2-polyprenyl-3-methyl-5-hydroxy-6-metoxy-1,4-benzoquinol methylase